MRAHPAFSHQRRGLLAKIHIAKQELGMLDEDYRAILAWYGVESAAELSIPELEDMLDHFKHLGWGERLSDRGRRKRRQIDALRRRAEELAGRLDNGLARLPGLVKKICGVDSLDWCRDEKKLRRLLKALAGIKRRDEREGGNGRAGDKQYF